MERRRLSELSPVELLERAHDYRSMAATASTDNIRASLEALAIRFAALAAERQAEVQSLPPVMAPRETDD